MKHFAECFFSPRLLNFSRGRDEKWFVWIPIEMSFDTSLSIAPKWIEVISSVSIYQDEWTDAKFCLQSFFEEFQFQFRFLLTFRHFRRCSFNIYILSSLSLAKLDAEEFLLNPSLRVWVECLSAAAQRLNLCETCPHPSIGWLNCKRLGSLAAIKLF